MIFWRKAEQARWKKYQASSDHMVTRHTRASGGQRVGGQPASGLVDTYAFGDFCLELMED